MTVIITNAKYNMNIRESVYNAFANNKRTIPNPKIMNISNKFPRI